MQRWAEAKMIIARRHGMVRSGAGHMGAVWGDDRVVSRGTDAYREPSKVSDPESRPSGHKTPAVVLKSDRPKAWGAKGRVRYA